jgi:hypothetical protein
MDQTRPKTKKRADAARGAKALITAGAIAATLGGWAVLSVGDAQANAQPGGAVAAAPPTTQQQPVSPRRGRFQPRTGTTQPNFGGFTPDQGTVPGTGATTPSLGGSSGSSGSTTLPRVRTRSSR